MDYGWLSILPPLVAIIMAITTKQVLLSILSGLLCGEFIVQKGFFIAFGAASADIAEIFNAGWASMTIIFCLAIGAIVYGIQASGGVEGFVNYLTEKQKIVKSRVGAQLIAYITGIIIFIETSSTILISGAVAKPVIDKFGVSREKLAYICDSTSAPVTWLVPFTSAGGFLMGLLGSQIEAGVVTGDPLGILLSSIPFQFYSILAVIFVGFTIFSGKEWGPMKKAEQRMIKDINSGSKSDDIMADVRKHDESFVSTKEGVEPKMRNMVIPIVVLIASIFMFFIITGDGNIARGDGTISVYWGIFLTILVSGILYVAQKICSIKEYIEWCIKGMKNLLYIVIILTCAFAIGSLIGELGTGVFLANLLGGSLSPALVPALVFILSCLMGFATGTSAGTCSVFIPVTLPFALALGAPIPMTIGAVVSGAVFGDHCSPISDTTILSSMIAGCEHMEHYRTQVFYSLFVGAIAIVFYVLFGFLLT